MAINTKTLNMYKVVANTLQQLGWEVLDPVNYSIFSKNRCNLFMQGKTLMPTEFVYTSAESKALLYNKKKTRNNCISRYDLPNYSWHLEYDNLVLGFGKLPQAVGDINTETFNLKQASNKAESQLIEFVTWVEALANGDDFIRMRNVAVRGAQLLPITKKQLVPYYGQDLRSYMLFELKAENKYWLLIIKDSFAMLYTISIQDPNDVCVTVLSKNPTVCMLKEFEEQLKSADTKIYTLEDVVHKTYKTKWELNKNIIIQQNKELQKFDYLNLTQAESTVLSKALDANLNYTALLQPNVDVLTMEALIPYLMAHIDVQDINRSQSPDTLNALYEVAKSGFNIKDYLTTTLTTAQIAERIQQFKDGTRDILTEYKNKGFNNEQLNYIQAVASYGKGIKHLLEETTLEDMWLAQAALETPEDSFVLNYLKQYGTNSNGAAKIISWNLLTDDIKDKVYEKFNSVPSFECFNGKSWTNALDIMISEADSLVYRPHVGLCVLTKFKYLAMDRNSLYITNSYFSNVWNAVYLNNEMVVNSSANLQIGVNNV